MLREYVIHYAMSSGFKKLVSNVDGSVVIKTPEEVEMTEQLTSFATVVERACKVTAANELHQLLYKKYLTNPSDGLALAMKEISNWRNKIE